MENDIVLQAFYWELNTSQYKEEYPEEANLWQLIGHRAEELAKLGITSVWLPPANKGFQGINDVGYGSYDLWDLGEFNQRGTVRTKYGTKSELEAAINSLHANDIKVYYDAVLNHMMGADETELVQTSEASPTAPGEEIEVWTKFNYPNRNEYSDFVWNWKHFNGTDWAVNREQGLYLFEDKRWDNTYQWEDDYPERKPLKDFVEYETEINNVLELAEAIRKVRQVNLTYLAAIRRAERLFDTWGNARMLGYEAVTNSQFNITFEGGEILPPWKSYRQGKIRVNEELLQAIDNYSRKE